ncbi:UDP-3-O-glucosamine N-acyltransferase [Butyriboletus roseoflavus]|nr:UDP-3-O-glucosamine N-acyltransferase [Butyriboletus roseoflavus]
MSPSVLTVPRLLPLTGDVGDEPCPKALLPISNRPMVDYALSWVEQSGIKDVLLICPSSHRPSISHYIHSESPLSSSSLQVDIQSFDETQELGVGTCSILRHFASRIQEDFVLLPCDFIPPPALPLSKLLNKFRSEATSDGAIATSCWFESPKSEKSTALDEWGSHSQSYPIVWDDYTGTLLYIDTLDNTDKNAEELELRMNLLSRYPRAKLSSRLQDSHVYVCKRGILDALQRKTELDSLREDFLPWLCKVHYQATKRSKYGRVLGLFSNFAARNTPMRHSTLHTVSTTKIKVPGYNQSTISSPVQHGRELGYSVPPSPTGPDNVCMETSSLRVCVIIHREEGGYCVRTNNLPAYLEANRHSINDTSYTLPASPQKRALIDAKASISPDSTIGDFTKVDERTAIKKSVIGKHCIIGKMAKIVGCVLLDHCVVSDGAKLEGSILGRNTRVGSKAELVRCVTQGGYEVRDNESYRNEKLDISDWGAENEDPNEDDEDEDSDESNEEAAQ